MKIKDYKCKCGHDDFFFADKGNQKGIYCSYCGKWLKWADKDEQNLTMKQEWALDKLRANIEQLKHQNTDVSGYRWWNNAIDNCLYEIDAFKAESEGQMETYGYCVYHEIECDYKGQCIDCSHNTEEDTEWFRQDEYKSGREE